MTRIYVNGTSMPVPDNHFVCKSVWIGGQMIGYATLDNWNLFNAGKISRETFLSRVTNPNIVATWYDDIDDIDIDAGE